VIVTLWTKARCLLTRAKDLINCSGGAAGTAGPVEAVIDGVGSANLGCVGGNWLRGSIFAAISLKSEAANSANTELWAFAESAGLLEKPAVISLTILQWAVLVAP
jgi:hypothetical protein